MSPSLCICVCPSDWKPHSFLLGLEDRIYLLDFFGTRSVQSGLAIPLSHVLTAFPTPTGNTFLGYVQAPMLPSVNGTDKKAQGVLWAKQASYVKGAAPCASFLRAQRCPPTGVGCVP